jgi:hypothetical protein
LAFGGLLFEEVEDEDEEDDDEDDGKIRAKKIVSLN